MAGRYGAIGWYLPTVVPNTPAVVGSSHDCSVEKVDRGKNPEPIAAQGHLASWGKVGTPSQLASVVWSQGWFSLTAVNKTHCPHSRLYCAESCQLVMDSGGHPFGKGGHDAGYDSWS